MRMVKPFRESLLDHCKQSGWSLKAVADGAGVSYEQVKKIAQRPDAKTNVDDAIKVAAFFGKTLNEFVDDALAQDRADLAAIYSRLTPQERRILQAAARGLPGTPLLED